MPAAPVKFLLAGVLLAVGALMVGAPMGAEPAGESETSRDSWLSDRGEVWVVELDGPLGPAVADFVMRALDDAEEAGARALVIRMDTPGGLDMAMRDVVKRILAAEVPVITFVAPDGARAASAGTYIAMASHIAAMAPATNIGSSTPVSIAPGPAAPTPGRAPREEPGDAEPGRERPADESAAEEDSGETRRPAASGDAMTRKVINDAVAYLQSLAELRGRNVEWAEETVRYGANLRASQALEQNVVDIVAPDLQTLLDRVDGISVTLASGTVTLRVADAGIRRVETDWQHDLLAIITNPSIAYGLLIFGIYGIILEFYSPGMVFPSVIGIICVLLGAYGLQMLPINYAGLALIIVGIGMLVAEVFTPTLGILGFGGVVAFVIGSMMLIDTEAPGYRVPILVVGAFAVAGAGLTVFAIGFALRARRQKVTTGQEAMVGATAEVLEDFSEEGPVWAFSERWHARSDRPVHRGDHVRITGMDGLILTVSPE